MFNKMIPFIKNQIYQIRKGGIKVLYAKIQKMFWVVSMNIISPAIIHFEFDWLPAYRFMGTKLGRQYKKMLFQQVKNREKIEKTRKQLIDCMEKLTSREPFLDDLGQWTEANRALDALFLFRGEREKCLDVCQRAYDIRKSLLSENQLDELDFEFVPRAVAKGSIGVYEFLEVYIKAGLLGLLPRKQLLLLLDENTPVNNQSYLDYWGQYIKVIKDPLSIKFLEAQEKTLTTPLTFHMPINGEMYASRMALGMVREKWISAGRSAVLSLSDNDYKRGRECLTSLGVPKDAWFVCLHVRESGWNDDDTSPEKFRNADIKTYIPAIKAITAAGGWVIRVGDSAMQPLPEMNRVIDYAHSNSKSEWMDMFLFSQCRFFVGTSSGPYTVATAFGVPVILTNLLPVYALYYLSSQDLFIPGLCWKKQEKGLMSFEELIAPPMDLMDGQYVNNEPEDIREVVKEMLHRCDGAFEYSDDDKYLQERFRLLAASCGSLYGSKDIVMNASIGKNFLRKYAHLLPAKKPRQENAAMERVQL